MLRDERSSLAAPNGFPLRLIAPGWYGIANAKWLKRIEVRDRRLESLLMGRDYVTLREEDHNGETVWAETSVGRARLKSAPARVTRVGDDYRIVGAAWGAPIDRVEVKIDDGPWMPATIDHSEEAEFAWKIWSLDWPIRRRRAHRHLAGDRHERQHPAGDGRSLDRQEAHLLGKQRADHAARSRRVTFPAASAPDRLVDQSAFVAARGRDL